MNALIVGMLGTSAVAVAIGHAWKTAALQSIDPQRRLAIAEGLVWNRQRNRNSARDLATAQRMMDRVVASAGSGRTRYAVQAMTDLAHTTRSGIPDRYNGLGQRIPGVPPDPRRAIYYYELLWSRYGVPEALLWAGDVYYHDLEAPEQARGIYERAIRSITTSPRYRQAKAAYVVDVDPPRSHMYEDLILERIRGRLSQIEYDVMSGVMRGQGTSQGQGPGLGQGPGPGQGQGRGAAPRPENFAGAVKRHTRLRSDPQNVHDSSLIASTKKTLRLLSQAMPTVDVGAALREVRQAIAGDPSSPTTDRQRDAVKALDAIERASDAAGSPLEEAEMSQARALALVWTRIKAYANPDTRATLTANLVNELAECVEHGRVVCARGRYARLVDALNGIDEAVDMRPKWALHEEMMRTAANLRERYEAEITDPDMREALDSLTPTARQQELQAAFSRGLREKILDQFHRDYVDAELLTPDELMTQVAPWIDHV